MLGNGLKELRLRAPNPKRRDGEHVGFTIEDVAEWLGKAPSTVSRYETAELLPPKLHVTEILRGCGIPLDSDIAQELYGHLSRAKTPGWWDEYTAGLPKPYTKLMAVESDAQSICTYEVVVPGLLQTERYAYHALMKGTGGDEEATRVRVEARMRRQEILTRSEDPVSLLAVLDEAAIRRRVGGPAVMREQFDHLLKLSELPHVRLQVLPFTSGPLACASSGFALLRFPPPASFEAVYIGGDAGDVYTEKPGPVSRFTMMFADTSADALGGAATRSMIKESMDAIE